MFNILESKTYIIEVADEKGASNKGTSLPLDKEEDLIKLNEEGGSNEETPVHPKKDFIEVNDEKGGSNEENPASLDKKEVDEEDFVEVDTEKDGSNEENPASTEKEEGNEEDAARYTNNRLLD